MKKTNNLSVPFSKKALRLFHTIVLKLLPCTPLGDHIYSLLVFIAINKRFPSKTNGTLNDELFFLKTTKEITNPLRVYVTDKEFVKYYITAKIGERYNIPTYAVLRTVEEALSYNFPEKCVIKPTHLSGEIMFRRCGEKINSELIKKWFKTNYYYDGREANYKNLLPKLIVEPFIFNQDHVIDYKIFCSNGKPKVILVVFNTTKARNLYTTDWELLPFTMDKSMGPGIAQPKNLKEMLHISSILSKDFNCIRVDMYSDGENIFLGELTNCHWNASVKFLPRTGEKEFWKIVSEQR